MTGGQMYDTTAWGEGILWVLKRTNILNVQPVQSRKLSWISKLVNQKSVALMTKNL